jgi:UDP-N-acetylglucosamine:LPS N-acetylglucosamine transferase
MKRIDIIFFDVTSGHRTAAFALEKALMMQDASLEIRVVNFIEILESHKVLQTLAQIGIAFSNWCVRHEKAWFMPQQIGVFQTIQAHLPDNAIHAIASFWRTNPPDLVVSVMPIVNWMLERALHHALPNSPYLVIPVDFEESKANYWFDTRADAYYLNPTETLVSQSKRRGVADTRSLRLGGMPIDPIFYNNPPHDKASALQGLGLNPDYPTVLVCFGGQGSIMVERCAAKLSEIQAPINAIFLCGRDEQLLKRMKALETPYAKAVLGYMVEAPAYYYHLADILIGKPGSMTITEAIITHTPIVAIEAQTLALVQRGNEAWLRQSGVGEVAKLESLQKVIERILSSKAIQTKIEGEWHRGVFEIAEIIRQFLQTGVFQAVNDYQIVEVQE